MTVTPKGLPSWTRSVGFADYGGHSNLANYQNQGVVNPRTDVGAEALARLTSDLAAVVRVMPFATLTVQCNDSSPAAPTITATFLQTGVNAISYAGDAAPTGFPSGARVGNGHVTLTFASSYTDAYGVAASFGIQQAAASLHGTSAGTETVNYTAGGQTLDVYGWVSAGTAKSDALLTVEVW